MSEKTILEISLYAQYYKKDITDRYMINNKSLIITNDAIDILDKPQKQLYIEPWAKKVEKDKEIERLTAESTEWESKCYKYQDIIDELEKMIDNFDVFKEFTFPLMKRDEEQQVKSSIDYEWRKSIKEPFLNKIKELKGSDDNE